MAKIKAHKDNFHTSEDVNFILMLAAIGSTLFFLIGAGLSSTLYSNDIGNTNNGWSIGVCLLAISLLILSYLFFSKTIQLTTKWAGATIVIFFAASYLFTNSVISPYIFTPLPWYLKFTGLTIGVGSNIWWMRYSAKNIHKIFYDPELRETLFKEEDNRFIYKNGIHQTIIEKKLKRHYFPHRLLWIILIPLQPFSFFIHKLITNSSGTSTFSVFLSAISLPLSLMFNGLIVSLILIYFYYPSILRKTTGKEVHVV
ncbi:MAG: hypothetical protein K2Q15_04960 [Burkholderiales bacterium]|jgi:hypothetical protein|nr:hypothetical protein [Burkholderiales bacterium]